jgi:hypothetical protein
MLKKIISIARTENTKNTIRSSMLLAFRLFIRAEMISMIKSSSVKTTTGDKRKLLLTTGGSKSIIV